MHSSQLFSARTAWIVAFTVAVFCSAAPLLAATEGVLDQVIRKVERTRDRGATPVVIFDLDDTVFRTSYRTKAVLQNWARALAGEQSSAIAQVESLEPERMPYELSDTLDMAGIRAPELRKSAEKAWFRGFFGSDFMTEDRAIRGAPEYAHELLRAGAKLVYLTARDAPQMKRGTLRQLELRGFPMPGGKAGVVLMMKPDFRIKDVVYKESVAAQIKAMGRVVASFDNEPKNLHMFRKRFPGALLIYVDTPHSKDAPPLTPAMRTIIDFAR